MQPEPSDVPMGGLGDGTELQPSCESIFEQKSEPVNKPTDRSKLELIFEPTPTGGQGLEKFKP